MTIFEDPLYQKYITLIVVEEQLRIAYIRWMNTQIPYFDLDSSISNLIEVKKVTYVQDRFGSEVLLDVPLNPNAIINIKVKTEFGYNDTVRRVSFDNFGTISAKLREEFKNFASFRQEHYQVCRDIHDKYMYKTVTNGKKEHKISKIEYYAMPLFSTRSKSIREERIKPQEFWLPCNTN